MIRALAASALTAMLGSAAALPAFAQEASPLVIAHRGASGYRPEHTLGSYALAVDMGADCIEPDLVMTRDGALVARHEPEIGATTDVAERFPDRRTKKAVDGQEVEGWFAEDFTLAEIKTLRAKQPRAYRASAWDGIYEVPTFQEVIELARQKGEERGRTVCLYPETKHPTYFAEKGLDIDRALVAALAANGLTEPSAPVFVQSFEVGNLKRLAGMTGVRLVQLFDDFDARPYDLAKAGDPRRYRDLMAPGELKKIAAYAYGIGPWKRTIVGEDGEGRLQPAGRLIEDAHAAGLKVHAYTFRDEPQHLAKDYGNDPIAEYLQFYRLGLDGVFSDFPDTALRARARLHER
jgi:glycerophosphoryl diester phosphodiesterase